MYKGPIFLSYNTLRCRTTHFADIESVLFLSYNTFRCFTYYTIAHIGSILFFLYNTFRCRMIQFAHTESVLFELYGTFRCRTYDTLCPYRISPIFCHATLSYFCATHFSVISVGLCKYPITYVCSTRSS
jgi:hypothetical protein